MTAPRPSPRSRERVAALVVSLILLVVATITTLAAVRGVTLQERMTGNLYDRSIAMQAAEAAIRAAEAAILADPDIGVDCRNQLCPSIPANTFDGNDSQWRDVPGAFRLNDARSAGTAQYHVQLLGEAEADPDETPRSARRLQYGADQPATGRIYRITVRSRQPSQANDRALVVLSSHFRRGL